MRIQITKLLPRTLEQTSLWLTIMIIALVPFHAFLTVWFSSIFGHYTALRLWKEILLVVIVVLAVCLLIRSRQLLRDIWGQKYIRWLFVSVGAYVLLHIVLGGIALWQGNVTEKALGYALISNLRYPFFFLACLVIGFANRAWIQAHWQKLLLWPAAIVVGFGLLQIFILPVDWLKHVGYGPSTIEPYIAVDQKVEFARAQSTLRGPNPLGAYLLLILMALAGMYAAYKKYGQIAIGILLGLTVLYSTYSRSAWIGLVVSLVALAWLLTRSAKARKFMVVGAIGLIVVGVASVYAFRNNDYVQNVLFHTDETSQSAMSSNEGRANAIVGGLEDIVQEPFGRGPGTAGPASVYNDDQTRIAENYFIQIGQEVGVLGLVLFIAICGVVGYVLWRLTRVSLLAGVLLASLVGLSVINLLSHAWTDDTVSYIWWGLAGLVIGAALTRNKQNTDHAKEAI